MNTDKLHPQNGELLSALSDSELKPEEFAALSHAYKKDSAASGSWDAYHVIGKALRSPGSTVQLTDFAFLARLNQQLAKEPSFGTGLWASTPIVAAGERRGPASNDGNFRWKMVAGFACAAAVSAIAWSVNGLMPPAAGPQLAQVETSAGGATGQQFVVAAPQGLMVRDARLEELLAAHKQFGATSAFPVPSGFLRNATFETPQSLGR